MLAVFPTAQVVAEGGQFIASKDIDAVFAGAGAVGVADGFGADVQAPRHQATDLFDELAQFVNSVLCLVLLFGFALDDQGAVVGNGDAVDFVAGFADAVRNLCAQGVLGGGKGAGEFEEDVFLDPAATEVFGCFLVGEGDGAVGLVHGQQAVLLG